MGQPRIVVVRGGRPRASRVSTVIGIVIVLIAAAAAVNGKHQPHAQAATQQPQTAAVVSAGHANPAAAAAIKFARQQVGKPYLWGGTGPDAFDCSGLLYMAYGQRIPRTSQTQWAGLRHVTEAELRPGDLVFYHGYLSDGEQPPGHVALYLGGGWILEAYATNYPIRVTRMRSGAWGFARP